MNNERLAEFLDEYRFASVSSLRKNGAPFTIPLGFLYDKGFVYLTIGGKRSGIFRLRRDPRVCVCVFDNVFPPSWVIIEGRADEIDDPGDEISLRIMERYMRRVPGLDFERFKTNFLAPGRTVFRVAIENMVTEDGREIQNYEEDGSISPGERRERDAKR